MPKEKDSAEKTLESYNDVFADIVNHALFKQPLVCPEELEDAVVTSQLKLTGGLTEQERDTAKRWKDGTITLAFLGIENQTETDSSMPLRVVSYDGAVYKGEVNQRESERRTHSPLSPFYPSVTVVLYFGLTRWTGPRTLAECFSNLPEALCPFVPDYRIPIVEVAFLTPEEVAGFDSDFRFIADYLVQVRNTGIYEPSPSDRQVVHVDETLKLMGAITGDRLFEAAVQPSERKEGMNVYRAMEENWKKAQEELRKKYEPILAEKDRSLAEYARAMAEKDRAMAEKDRAMAELREELRTLRSQRGA